MAKKKKQPADINALAKSIVSQATDQPLPDKDIETMMKATAEGKDPLAVLLGQRGGLKGGKARAKSLSATRRKEIAREAAKARWARNKKK